MPDTPVVLAEAVESWHPDPDQAYAALGWDGLNGYTIAQAEPADPTAARQAAVHGPPYELAQQLDRHRQAAAWAIHDHHGRTGWLYTTHTITTSHQPTPS